MSFLPKISAGQNFAQNFCGTKFCPKLDIAKFRQINENVHFKRIRRNYKNAIKFSTELIIHQGFWVLIF